MSPPDRARDQWVARANSGAGARLSAIREGVFDLSQVARHHLILDLGSASGLLTWEGIRRAPEGQVWAVAETTKEAEFLLEIAEKLDHLYRPVVLLGELKDLIQLVQNQAGKDVAPKFDRVFVRGIFQRDPSAKSFQLIAPLLADSGAIVVIEPDPDTTQRLYRLLPDGALSENLLQQLAEAEENIYRDAPNGVAISNAAKEVGLATIKIRTLSHEVVWRITERTMDRWFTTREEGRPSFVDHVAETLDPKQIKEVQDAFKRCLLGQNITWKTGTLLVRVE